MEGAALLLLIGWETDWGRQIVRVPSTPPAAEPKPVSAAVLPDYQIDGGLPAHAETVQRTLFNATRRPAPVLAAEDGPRQIVRGHKCWVRAEMMASRNSFSFCSDFASSSVSRSALQKDFNHLFFHKF